ncbi:hypothetical protein PV325_006375 [Microctonus aethiopoides]|uniref:Uncharacterized protein n=1 Tax=Microctonus aethiopoides TaxID=144406 RepID=A0AA39C3M2_9HYME|nr:hypothetical protein PV325_006375 [Microctonus aethiopoides]KAK0157300.1 hypothetical protein PV328_011058 [Microctonus aethiopoides]
MARKSAVNACSRGPSLNFYWQFSPSIVNIKQPRVITINLKTHKTSINMIDNMLWRVDQISGASVVRILGGPAANQIQIKVIRNNIELTEPLRINTSKYEYEKECD